MFKRYKTVIIDIQFNVNSSGYFIKEMGILKMENVMPFYFLIKPPFEFNRLSKRLRRQNRYNANNINGLQWECGNIDTIFIQNILDNYSDYTIIVKGKEKRDVLRKFLKHTEILDLGSSFSIKELPDYVHNCPHHDQNYRRCVLNNTFKIRSWIEKHMNIE